MKASQTRQDPVISGDRKPRAATVALLLLSVIVSLVAGEIMVRAIAHVDDDHNVTVREKLLKPFRFPLHLYGRWLESYVKNVDEQTGRMEFVSHDRLGWTADPRNSTFYNAQGIAPPTKVFPASPHDDIVRIALFGDSMTRASRASTLGWEETWGHVLEQNLTTLGFQVEVMNFGVPGYGIDQIYLRWEIEGKQYKPDIVIFGFYPLDIGRSLEVHRSKNSGIYGGLFFSKPRFLLRRDADRLDLVNSPTIPVEKIFDNARSFDALAYMDYDSVYTETRGDYQDALWNNSYLFNFLWTNWGDNRWAQMDYRQHDAAYDMKKEGAQLALKLIHHFQASSKQAQAEFITVVLPSELDLFHLKKGRALRYAHLIDAISAYSPVMHAEETLKSHEIDELFLPNDSHYSSLGNRLVAQVVGEYLAEHLPQLAAGKRRSLASGARH